MDSILFGQIDYQINKKALDATALSLEGTASNIANASTPGYQRVKLPDNFENKLKESIDQGSRAIREIKITLEKDASAPANHEGNTVNMDRELIEMKEGGMRHQYLTTFLSNSIKQINAAISQRTL